MQYSPIQGNQSSQNRNCQGYTCTLSSMVGRLPENHFMYICPLFCVENVILFFRLYRPLCVCFINVIRKILGCMCIKIQYITWWKKHWKNCKHSFKCLLCIQSIQSLSSSQFEAILFLYLYQKTERGGWIFFVEKYRKQLCFEV